MADFDIVKAEQEFGHLGTEIMKLGQKIQDNGYEAGEDRDKFERMYEDQQELGKKIRAARNIASLNQDKPEKAPPVPSGVVEASEEETRAVIEDMQQTGHDPWAADQRRQNPRSNGRELTEMQQRAAYNQFLLGTRYKSRMAEAIGYQVQPGDGGFPDNWVSDAEIEQRTDYAWGWDQQTMPDFHEGMGIYVPRNRGWWKRELEKRQQAAQPQGPTGTAGGATVPDWPIRPIEEALKAFGGMRMMSEIVATSHGGDMPWPSVDDTSQVGMLLTENTQVDEQAITYGQKVFKAYKYSSKLVRASVEFLQDSATNQMALIPRLLGIRIGRITNTQFTTGTGTAQPQGIVTAAAAGPTAASTTVLTWPELLALKASVDPAYVDTASTGWMFNWNTLMTQLRTLQSDRKVPLWNPSLEAGAPATFDGDPYVVNQDMASAAAAAIPVIYGDLSKYKIRDVLGITQLVLRERYADYHQLGFLAFSRHDGQLLDAGTNPVKKLTMAAS